MTTRYLLSIIWNEPHLHGPFDTDDEQNLAAFELGMTDDDADLYWLHVEDNGELSVGAYGRPALVGVQR